MGNTAEIQSPLHSPAIRPIEKGQPSEVKRSHDNQAELSKEWDQRKATPVGLDSTPTGQGFAKAIDERATRAIEGAKGLERRLGTSLDDPNFQMAMKDALLHRGVELSPSELQKVVHEITDKMDSKAVFSTPKTALQEVQAAKEQLESAHKLLAASQASHPTHAGQHRQMRDAQGDYNAHSQMIDAGIRMAEAAEGEVGRYAQKIGERLDTIQQLNEIDSLMEKYKHLESVDLTKPGDGQERDFRRIETLRHTLVEKKGVPLSWTEGKWLTKGEFEALKKGIDLSRQALFSENQTAQIYLQKVSTSSQQFFLLVTTMITKYAELIKECIRNTAR